MRLTQGLLDGIREMYATIAPEVENLVVVDSAELTGVSSTCLGFAIPDPLVAAAVLARSVDAPGPLIAIDGAAIAETSTEQDYPANVLSVAVHELAHVVACSEDNPAAALLEGVKVPEEFIEQTRSKASAVLSTPGDVPSADVDHGADFCRMALHTYSRALLAGYDINVDGVLTDHLKAIWYFPACLRDIMESRHLSLVEIARTPTPAPVLERWQSDVAYYDQLYRNQDDDPASTP